MKVKNLYWESNTDNIDFEVLSHLYKVAPLGDKSAKDLEVVFSNSMFKYFVYDEDKLVGVGRALADGVDCSYICDVAIDPKYQSMGIGKAIMEKLIEDSKEHQKIILYSVPTKEKFYKKLGFSKMKTAMAIFQNQDRAKRHGIVE